MPRPERPVEGTGPLADLVRELRRIRQSAGTPGYRELSAAASFSRETLSAAARGEQCPTWAVTKAFADACDPAGDESRKLRHLWERADRASHRKKTRARRPAPGPAQAARAGRPSPVSDGAPQPDPSASPAEFVYQLRVLRAWAGSPGPRETAQRRSRSLPSSTMYDALSPRRTTLPSLRAVQLILRACLDDEDEIALWVSAWRRIAVREFTAANPWPGPAGNEVPPLRAVPSPPEQRRSPGRAPMGGGAPIAAKPAGRGEAGDSTTGQANRDRLALKSSG